MYSIFELECLTKFLLLLFFPQRNDTITQLQPKLQQFPQCPVFLFSIFAAITINKNCLRRRTTFMAVGARGGKSFSLRWQPPRGLQPFRKGEGGGGAVRQQPKPKSTATSTIDLHIPIEKEKRRLEQATPSLSSPLSLLPLNRLQHRNYVQTMNS